MRSTPIRGPSSRSSSTYSSGSAARSELDAQPPARLDAPAHPHARAGLDVRPRRRLQRAGAVAEHEPPRIAGAHQQHLVDLLPGGELTDAHSKKP